MMLSLDEFDAMKRRTLETFRPCGIDDLTGMIVDIEYSLDESPLFEDSVVNMTSRVDCLVAAQCRAVPASTSVHEVENELERIWTNELRYQHSEAHTVVADESTVILRAVTTSEIGGYFVTVEITVDVQAATATV
jgi:hypothetical protein